MLPKRNTRRLSSGYYKSQLYLKAPERPQSRKGEDARCISQVLIIILNHLKKTPNGKHTVCIFFENRESIFPRTAEKFPADGRKGSGKRKSRSSETSCGGCRLCRQAFFRHTAKPGKSGLPRFPLTPAMSVIISQISCDFKNNHAKYSGGNLIKRLSCRSGRRDRIPYFPPLSVKEKLF